MNRLEKKGKQKRGCVDPSLLFKENPDGVDAIETEHISFFWGQSGEDGVLGDSDFGTVLRKSRWTTLFSDSLLLVVN
jgi:hypothetical protein